jgi:DNA-binding MarR family transcriptional regulator
MSAAPAGPGSAAGDPGHPVNGLDDVVHQRVRLGVLTIAHEARRVEFGFLRSQLELTAGNLSQHLGVLESAGLVEVEKGYAGKRGRTWITLTAAGQDALDREIARLKLLISRVEAAGNGTALDAERHTR